MLEYCRGNFIFSAKFYTILIFCLVIKISLLVQARGLEWKLGTNFPLIHFLIVLPSALWYISQEYFTVVWCAAIEVEFFVAISTLGISQATNDLKFNKAIQCVT